LWPLGMLYTDCSSHVVALPPRGSHAAVHVMAPGSAHSSRTGSPSTVAVSTSCNGHCFRLMYSSHTERSWKICLLQAVHHLCSCVTSSQVHTAGFSSAAAELCRSMSLFRPRCTQHMGAEAAMFHAHQARRYVDQLPPFTRESKPRLQLLVRVGGSFSLCRLTCAGNHAKGRAHLLLRPRV
jgi:hypothetical protein